MKDKGTGGIEAALNLIKAGVARRIELSKDVTAYKVPSNNPNKYLIRVDIWIDEEDEKC